MASDPTFVLDEISATELRVASSPPAVPPDIAIRANGVGKMYRIYDRPQDRLKQMMFWRFGRSYGREFWALREASFEIERGEAVGIIGRNGSGKSTMLQMITGTLEPTCGSVEVQGRVAALLELGSGFNPEFTGRENVFLNGAVLGISQEEIAERFDTIAAFADIGDFIEQPVKLYSSGMLVRLAFAVQAHLDPDVLIVDEALSVGDIYFQHKCMRHIKRLIDRGTTLLFVSHDIETVRRFCRRGIWLDSGEVRAIGAAGEVADKYLAFMRMREEQEFSAQQPLGAAEAAPIFTMEAAKAKVKVDGVIDLDDERLYVGAPWESITLDTGEVIRKSASIDSIAAFRAGRGELVLRFLCTQDSGDVRVIIDNDERYIALASQSVPSVRTVTIPLATGEHQIALYPTSPYGAPVYWLGGEHLETMPLIFRRDSRFDIERQEIERYGSGKMRITAVELLDEIGEELLDSVRYGQRVRLRIHAERLMPYGPRVEFSYIVRDRNRIDLFGTTSIDQDLYLDPTADQIVAEFVFAMPLGPGSYSILVAVVECSQDLTQRIPMDQIDIAKVFEVPFEAHFPIWYLFHVPVVAHARSIGGDDE